MHDGGGLIHRFSVFDTDAAGSDLVHLRKTVGLPDLEAWRVYYIEFERDPGDRGLASVRAALAADFDTSVVLDQPWQPGTVLVSYRRGVVDNANDSIIAMCSLLGLAARAGKVAVCYRSSSPNLRQAIETNRYNHTIEELHESEPEYATLVPVGRYEPPRRYDLEAFDDEALAALGKDGGRNLSLAHMRHIRRVQQALGEASVTDVFLEALDARWSDHCAHTTWRSLGNLLGRLVQASRDTHNPNIVSMFHDNAGVWDFYEGYALAIKAETHNGPSGISAYFGQLTKLGGVLRDILGTGLGADPIGSFEYTATGRPEDPPPIAGRPGARSIALDTIRGIKEYGNTFGVPMMWSRMTFHPSYRAKPFALGGSIGILPVASAQKGKPVPGDLVVLIGGLTGNEGMHGASASSAGSTMDEASVQIGAPLEQVKFRKALLDLRDAGCVRAITDVGGAGLNSAVGEIGEACGVWINTALVPLKTAALPMWRILLSESQERMILAVSPARLSTAREILARHQVRTSVIGRFTGTERYCVFHQPELDEAAVVALEPGTEPADRGELGFDAPYALLDVDVEQQHVGAPPAVRPTATSFPVLPVRDLPKLLEQVVSDAEVASQAYADSQYDSTILGHTTHGPRYGRQHAVTAGYWAGTPVEGSPAAAVVSTVFNPWLYELHPVLAVRQSWCALIAGQVLAGVAQHDICVCDNFYTPQLREHWREWLVGMVDELAALTRRFGTPVISGKDSSAGSVRTDEGVVSVPPAVFLTALGKVADASLLLGELWRTPGRLLVTIGPRTPSPAGTVAARVLGLEGGALDEIRLDEMESYLAVLASSRRFFASATRLGPGGLAATLVSGALASGLGVELDDALANVGALFAENRCGALVEIDEGDLSSLPPGLSATAVGRVTTEPGVRLAGIEFLTPAVVARWSHSFADRIA